MLQNEVQHKMSGGFFILCGKMMVFCMTVHTVSLNSGGCEGLFAAGLFDPAADKPIFFIFAMQCFMVMCVQEDIRIIKKWHVECHFFISPILFSEAFQAWLFLHRKVCR